MRSRSYTLIPTNSNSRMIAQATASHQVRQAASGLAAFGICVNAIAPGPFLTRITTTELRAFWEKALPARRVASADERQQSALFLASPVSACVTGAQFVIDGNSMLGQAA